MKHLLVALICALVIAIGSLISLPFVVKADTGIRLIQPSEYWLLLHRQSNKEYLYKGSPGDIHNSQLIKTFTVKTGVPAKRPTPLPQKLGHAYWVITNYEVIEENPETHPYFLQLNVPVGDEEPFGPTPYDECDGQCNWELPGFFGLHGVGGDPSKLTSENEGSSGCIRHTDSDITYLYTLLHSQKNPIQYYIEDK